MIQDNLDAQDATRNPSYIEALDECLTDDHKVPARTAQIPAPTPAVDATPPPAVDARPPATAVDATPTTAVDATPTPAVNAPRPPLQGAGGQDGPGAAG